MEHLIIEDLGMRFPTATSPKKYRYILAECVTCSKHYEVDFKQWKNSPTKMCKPCSTLKRASDLRTVDSTNPAIKKIYQAWADMKGRCYNPKSKEFIRYGSRGITVCDEWINDSAAFIEWALSFGDTSNLSLDRRNNDLGYSPDNCRWTDKSTQTQNTRTICSTNTSGYRGVSYEKLKGTWASKICVNNKHIRIGTFKTAEEAAKAYDEYVLSHNLEHNINNL